MPTVIITYNQIVWKSAEIELTEEEIVFIKSKPDFVRSSNVELYDKIDDSSQQDDRDSNFLDVNFEK